MLETPRQLAARFERGEIDRTEFQSLMAIHARGLIAEIEENHQNPLAAWIGEKSSLFPHDPYIHRIRVWENALFHFHIYGREGVADQQKIRDLGGESFDEFPRFLRGEGDQSTGNLVVIHRVRHLIAETLETLPSPHPHSEPQRLRFRTLLIRYTNVGFHGEAANLDFISYVHSSN